MAVDFYLKLDGIDGESPDAKHTNEIGIMSFAWGGSQVTTVATQGGSGAGRASLHDLTITKTVDKATAKLFKALLQGTHIKTGTLTANKAGGDGKPFLKIDLGELFVTNIQVSGSSEVPSESVSFSYNTFKIDYSVQNDQGNLASTGAVSYNLKANTVS